MKAQLVIDFEKPKSVSKGVHRFLKETVHRELNRYEHYSIHERINFKGNYGSFMIIGTNRITAAHTARQYKDKLDKFYQRIWLNRFDCYRYTNYEQELFIRKYRDYNFLYMIIMKTVGNKKLRYQAIQEYIDTKSCSLQTKLIK